MLGTIDSYETECYCALLVETACCVMLKHALKLGNRIVMTCGNELRISHTSIVLKQKL